MNLYEKNKNKILKIIKQRNRHADPNADKGKAWVPQPYTKNQKKLRNAGS